MSYYGGGSLPQPLATTSTPQFARLGVGTASASANAVLVQKTSSGPGIKLRTGTVNDYGYNLNLVGSNANWVAASVGTEINSSNVWTARGTAFSIIVQDNAGKWVLYTGSGLTDGSTINTASYQRLTVDGTGNIIPGTGALATNATMGFSYIETCPGTPTGVPTAATGRSAMVWDSTNDKLYVYDGGWQQVGSGLTGYAKVQNDMREFMAAQTTSTFSGHFVDGDWHCLIASRYGNTGTWVTAADTYTVPAGKFARVVHYGMDGWGSNAASAEYATGKVRNLTDGTDVTLTDWYQNSNSGPGEYGIGYDNSGVTGVPAGKEMGIQTYLAADAPRATSFFVVFKVVNA